MLKIFSLTLLAASLFLCGCSSDSRPDAVLLEAAFQSAADGDWNNAGKLAETVLKRNPDQVDALILSALSDNAADAALKALDKIMKASELAPENFTAHYVEGYMFYRSGKFKQALAALKEAQRIRPADMNTAILTGQAALEVKDYALAIKAYSAIARNPKYAKTPYPWNGLGIALSARRPAQALRYFEAAAKFGKNDPGIFFNSAVLYDTKLGMKSRALYHYKQFLNVSERSLAYAEKRTEVLERVRLLEQR